MLFIVFALYNPNSLSWIMIFGVFFCCSAIIGFILGILGIRAAGEALAIWGIVLSGIVVAGGLGALLLLIISGGLGPMP